MRRKEVVVAVINKKAKNRFFKKSLITSNEQKQFVQRFLKKSDTGSLSALTTAALVLPGLLSSVAFSAEGDEVDFQYSHYQEGSRDIVVANPDFSLSGQKNSNPIEVESIYGRAKITLSDRVKFAFNYSQDTWGGATPISTAPAVLGGNQQLSTPDGSVVVGASPFIQSPNRSFATFFDKKYNIYSQNLETGENTKDNRLTHILATASPETRKQGDFKLSYQWDAAAVSAGGGISLEDDYESRFGNISGRLDLNQKRTILNLALSYTNSQTNAIINHDTFSYIEKDGYYNDNVKSSSIDAPNVLSANRQDWATNFDITQILNKDVLIEADVAYVRSTGYMSNPYKVTEAVFVDPQEFLTSKLVAPSGVAAFLERRPEVRNQWNLGGRYVQYIKPLDAALHFDYKFSADDWSIQTHSFEADWVQPLGDGWTVTPRVRYYSQDASNFYHPYFLVKKAYNSGAVDLNANSSQLPTNFSSDQRLSGFGALSGGVTISKRFAKGLNLETGFEYYTHQGSMKLGGGGEGGYADFDYWVANAALKVDLATLSTAMIGMGGMDHSAHAGHDMAHMNHAEHGMGQSHHHGVHGPAGVMFDHMLTNAGDMMVGYRYMYSNQNGEMLHGTNPVSDPAVVANGCGPNPCFLKPGGMGMHMHMLDIMYAPTDWLTLMLMPQWMDMNMSMNRLDGAPPPDLAAKNVGNPIDPATGAASDIGTHIPHHVQNGHETGGIGDLGMYALFKLFDDGTHHVHATAGLSAPTADVDSHLNRGHTIDGGFIHYGMQLGSGTWDLKPSLTYTGHIAKFSWGAQANGTVRMEDKNESGYALGDMFQATAWGSYNIAEWLSASVRGMYTLQGGLKGQFNGLINQFGPMDYPVNHGGKYWDVGFGLNAMIHSGDFTGNHFSVEWVQPVEDNVNGYQLDRVGTLNATWGIMF